MLPAGILAFMLPVEPEEGFYADPPIQRWDGIVDCRNPIKNNGLTSLRKSLLYANNHQD